MTPKQNGAGKPQQQMLGGRQNNYIQKTTNGQKLMAKSPQPSKHNAADMIGNSPS